MKRRKFVTDTLSAGMFAASMPFISIKPKLTSEKDLAERYRILDEILEQPVLKRDLFRDPVIIESLDLLRSGTSYICRVRTKDGAEGISIAHNDISFLTSIFLRKLKPFFIGQDVRELDLIMEKVYNYQFNFRYNGISLGIPLASIEFAILDMLGKIAGVPLGQLIGNLNNKEVGVYVATEFRELPLEVHFERIKDSVSEYDVKALKIKIGYMYAGTKDIHYPGLAGKSEKLIPMIREHYGNNWSLYADSNGYS